MTYKQGDIVLIKFPFTTLLKAKKRLVLVMKDENEYGDFVCFQVTSKSAQSMLCPLDEASFVKGTLPLKSYAKYDKCFTLSSEIVSKKLTSVNASMIEQIKKLFCAGI